MNRPIFFLIALVVFAFTCVECDYRRKKQEQALVEPIVNRASINDLTPNGLKHRMIEDQLQVRRFGRVSVRKNGKDDEYWEAEVIDTESRAVFSIRCSPAENKKWDEFYKELEERNFRWKAVPLSKEAIQNGWGESWSK